MRKIYRILGILLPACLLAGCSRQQEEAEEQPREEKTAIQIGMSFDSFLLERWQRDRDVFVSTAQELGAEVNVQNANGDLEEQISQIEYFMEKDVDAIVVVAHDCSGLSDAVEAAHREGIPVIAYDRLILNANVDLYISFDNEEVGRLMGEHMCRHLGQEGQILQICGPLTDNNVPMVMEGFGQALEGSGLEMAGTEHADNWLAEAGFTFTDSYLEAGRSLSGIMCGNDAIAGQAIRALSERRLAGSICVVGQDADLDACQRVVEGTQCMTVYKPVEKLARRAAELSVALAKGQMIFSTETIDDGTYQVPYERLEPVAVTRENMDEVITGKYHEESDIYLNVPDRQN